MRLLTAALLLLATTTAAGRPPNIVLIVSDDQRPDTIAALGNRHIQTPHLDDLVRRGTVFTRMTCAHPLCYPSRAELLTGCTGWRSGTYSELKLNADVPLLPRALRAAGYHTWYSGKWHTAGQPSSVGFDDCDGLYWGGQPGTQPYVDFRGRPATGYKGWQFQTEDRQRFPEKGIGLTPYTTRYIADAAVRVIRRSVPGVRSPGAADGAGGDRPFFLHVNFSSPHDPRVWPAGLEHRYQAAALPLPANFRPEHPFDHGNARGRDEVLLPFPRTADDVRQELACYYAMITDVDAQVGRIVRALEETGQREHTIVVFTSDHGLAIGSHGLVGKQNMYEHTINIPFVMAGPGVPAGQRRSGQGYLRDLFPTLCELAGVPAPPVDGRSLVPLLRGQTDEVHPFIVGYFQDAQRMIREGNWKLAWYPKVDRWQLFDLASDPEELHDLSQSPAQQGRIAALRAKLDQWRRQHGDRL